MRSYWYVITNERVCIQSGFIQRRIITIDLDKVISVKNSQSFAERILGLNSIELMHAGVNISGNYWSMFHNPNRIRYLDLKDKIASILINQWLPRDNKKI